MRLRDMERFIYKFYWFIILCFLAIGVAIVAVLAEGSFKKIFLAQDILSSIGITAYIVLLLMLLMCHSHKEMRIVILLSITFFVGVVGGFLSALHLLGMTITLSKNMETNSTSV